MRFLVARIARMIRRRGSGVSVSSTRVGAYVDGNGQVRQECGWASRDLDRSSNLAFVFH